MVALGAGGGVYIFYTRSSAQSIAGTLVAVEQIEVTGEPTIGGSIIARKDATDSTLLTDNVISCDMNISSNLADPLIDGIEISALVWRSVGN